MAEEKKEVRAGIERIWALCDFRLEFIEKRILPGNFFFTGAFFLHAGQDGSIADRSEKLSGRSSGPCAGLWMKHGGMRKLIARSMFSRPLSN